jgi:hypothetical protein
VPELLPTFNPEGTLDLTFSGQSVSIGQNLTQDGECNDPVSKSSACNLALSCLV